VHAVEGIGRRAVDDAINVVQGHVAVIEGYFGGLERQFLARLLGPADEPGHPRANNGDFAHTHGYLLEFELICSLHKCHNSLDDEFSVSDGCIGIIFAVPF